jgi:uncharacterized protein (DUF58 family)
MSIATRLRKRTRAWAKRRHGQDVEPFVIPTRRVYILPTRIGLFYAGMLLLMFLGAMNYANNLALGLTFILSSIGLVGMHYCQRNLVGVRIASGLTEPVFAGQVARFAIAFENDAGMLRHEIRVGADGDSAALPVSIESGQRTVVHVELPAPERGRLTLDHLQISTDYPFGLFRAWTHVNLPMSCIVYPKPASRQLKPPPTETDTGGAQEARRGEEDFAGLRSFQAGDSPRHIAWKAYARGQELQVKQYAGTAVTSHLLEWEQLAGMHTESRLSQLCRWIEDAHASRIAFGLRIPGTDIAANVGNAHRQRCLTALALFGIDPPSNVRADRSDSVRDSTETVGEAS